MTVLLLVLFVGAGFTVARTSDDKTARYLIACHTTDFVCFQRQYKALRDNVLLGNERIGIPKYEHFIFEYNNGTCVKLSGFEESVLVEISLQHHPDELSLTLELPMKIRQVNSTGIVCAKPDEEFDDETHYTTDTLMRYTGNATVNVVYPFSLKKKKKEVYMILEEEDIDVILDMPDLSHFDLSNEIEATLFEWSEWAFEAVQHIDAAQYFALPYTSQMRVLMENVPLERLLLLYPEESYTDVTFSFKGNASEMFYGSDQGIFGDATYNNN